MEKQRYEFDPYNKLAEKSGVLRGARRVLEGQFRVAEGNTLTYQIETPVPDGAKAPHQLKLRGDWSLTKEHELCLTLDKSARETFGDQVIIRGKIEEATGNSLLFAVTSKTKEGTPSIYIIELAGTWAADENNRLTFRVEKERGRVDILTFEGAWQINKDYQITYRCRKERLVRKDKESHRLTFQGQWEVRDKARLSYAVGVNSASGFDFKTSAGIFKDSYIKYELGIGITGRKSPVKRAVTFFGGWKARKGMGLVFEVKKEGSEVQAISFGAEVKLAGKGSLIFNLKNARDKGIGVELELSRDVFGGDGQVFLRMLESKKEAAILAGIGWKW